jgi:Uma2 family endonuclease
MSIVAATHPEVVERQRRIAVGEYHRMIEAGILGEDEHVQLIAGTLVAMTPQGSRHAVVIQRLTAALVRAVGGDLAVRPQLPLTLLEDSEPEPDLAVVRAADAPFDGPHPRGALLVVEVAGDSLRLDRESKATLYARAGIPEYWPTGRARWSPAARRSWPGAYPTSRSTWPASSADRSQRLRGRGAGVLGSTSNQELIP